MIYTNIADAAPAVAQLIAEARRIVILTHINPDGDAIGSMLGAWHALSALGKTATPLATVPLPSYALWLPGIERVSVYARGTPFPEADLLLMVDTASLSRAGIIYEEHAQTLTRLPTLIVDHHVTNDGSGTLNVIMPTAASTCELLYRLFQAMRVPINSELATCLLLGLTTDTQSLQTNSTSADSLRVAADLLELGADHRRVVQEVYYALPASSAALIGLGLNMMRLDGAIAWTTVTQEMMRSTGAEEEAGDELVRVLQRIAGVKALVLFKERSDGTTKISLRSKPPFNVAALAQRWGGGGHAQAAGATLPIPPAAAADEVLPFLRALVSEMAR
jgi:phosphoesterase RecJ-like protein